MKKTLVLSLMLLLSGCACLDGLCGDDEEIATPVTSTKTVYRGYDDNGCNHLNSENCERRIQNRYVYNQPQDYYIYSQPQPRRIVYRQPEPKIVYIEKPAQQAVVTTETQQNTATVSKTLASCGDIKTTSNEMTLPSNTSPCPSKVKEVREPVEVVFKKTTYKTTYEPKTTKTVTYEKEPYKQVKEEVVVKETQTAPETVETITTTTTTTTTSENSLDVLPADEIK